MSTVADWLRERAARIEAAGDAFGNVYGRALREAADDLQSDPAFPAEAAP